MVAQTLAEALAEGSAPQVQVDIDELLDKLTLEEQILLLSGNGNWETNPIERLKIPALKIWGSSKAIGEESFSNSTVSLGFPSYMSLAATFNTELANRIGQALGQCLKAKGMHAFIGPVSWSQQSSLDSQNADRFSGDPLLSWTLAVDIVKGLQSEQVGAILKYDMQVERDVNGVSGNGNTCDQASREYLKAWRMAVKNADPWCVMSGPAATHPLRQNLRDQLKCDGLIMSDYHPTAPTIESINEGIDLHMPGPASSNSRDLVMKAIDEGLITTTTIKGRARALLQLLQKTGQLTDSSNSAQESTDILREHPELVREAELEGIVLLKNEGNILPIDKTKLLKKVTLLGSLPIYPPAHDRDSNGVSPFDAFSERLGKDVEVTYFTPEMINGSKKGKETEDANTEARSLANNADYTIIFSTATNQNDLDSQTRFITKMAKSTPNTIVINTSTSSIPTPWLPDVAALIQTFYTGPKTIHSILDILSGDVNPSGKLPLSWPQDTPKSEEEATYTSTNEPNPLFPFGYGLSYTTLILSNSRLHGTINPTSNEGITISLFVTNTGLVAGSETIQAYIPHNDIPSHPQITSSLSTSSTQNKLMAFTKVSLEPEERRLVTLNFDQDAIARWDVESGKWRVKEGTYEILLGNSSRTEDLRTKLELLVKESFNLDS